MLPCIVLVILCGSARGQLDDVIQETDSATIMAAADDGSHTPSNVWLEAGEDNITVHWKPPRSLDGASYCTIGYKDADSDFIIRIPVLKTQTLYDIRGLRQNTLYAIQLHCVYGDLIGEPTTWFGAATRTVSVNPSVCTGRLPNAVLQPWCLERQNVRYSGCSFTCIDGYRKSDAPAIFRGRRRSPEDPLIYVYCRNGTWVTMNEDRAFGINDLCLPEAEFTKCPASIPNGVLEPHCGPATEWLCEVECNDGYILHPYMSGLFKNFFNHDDDMLLCDNGEWRTGYEHLGLDVSRLCQSREINCTDSDDIPHGRVTYLPCPAGHTCGFECDEGYRKHALSWDDPFCDNGVWGLRTTKYEPTLTPQNLCVLKELDATANCPSNIHHGHILDPDCKVDCRLICDEGYQLPGPLFRRQLTCESGQWLTDEVPYDSDNICFPDGGHMCPLEIPNGISSDSSWERADDGTSRRYIAYSCNNGFRRHPVIPQIECVAGRWVTWQERFGLNVSSVCIPYEP